jgi:hypothetical protein
LTKNTSMVVPTGRIVLDNQGIHHYTRKVESATSMYAGRLMLKGTNDDDVVCHTGSNAAPVGWLGYESTTKKYRPASISTIYVVDSQVDVFYGPGVVFIATLAGGVTAVPGFLLTSAPAGCLTGGTAGTDDIVAQAEESVTTVGATTGACLVRSRI